MIRPQDAPPPSELAAQLLSRIDTLAAQTWFRRSCFLYSTLTHEKVRGLTTSHPALCIILQGTKEIWQHGIREDFGPGALIALPKGVDIDIVNAPQGPSRPFVSLSLTIQPADLPAAPPVPEKPAAAPASRYRVTPNHHLTSAILRTCEDVSDLPSATQIHDLRRRELVLMLRTDPVAHRLFGGSVVQALGQLIRNAPDSDWTVPRAARALGVGASTLRRKLSEEATTFTQVVRDERLTVAHRVLADGASVLEARTVAGFRSRSHFARHFRARYGRPPAHA